MTHVAFSRGGWAARLGWMAVLLSWVLTAGAQSLWNVDFGAGKASGKFGPAAVGQGTNDFWNLYSHYDPRYVPGMALVTNGSLANLKLSDGSPSAVCIAVSNAPGVWGNTTGDAMMDSYLFAPNGGTLTVTLQDLGPGRYQFYLYGHGDPDVLAEQTSQFVLRSGTNTWGPAATAPAGRWLAGTPWQEGRQYVVFRDVWVAAKQPVVIEVRPGAGGMAVLNGLQIWNRGTSPTDLFTSAQIGQPDILTNLIVREVRYTGRISTNAAHFTAKVTVESLSTNELSIPLFTGSLAATASDLPAGWRLASDGVNCYLAATGPTVGQFTVELDAKVHPGETWRSVRFYGPAAVAASFEASADNPNLQVQLLSGLAWGEGASETNLTTEARGVIGGDRLVALRWRNKAEEATRKSFVTAETSAEIKCTPVVIKYDTKIQYEILQSALSRLTVALPENQALTQLQGEQIRDWRVETVAGRPTLVVEFLKPVEKSYILAIHTEQAAEATNASVALAVPQPLEVERESGVLVLRAEEVQAELGKVPGLLQSNPPEGALAAFRFNARPFQIAAKLTKIEPEITVSDRASLQVEENRLVASHALQVTVAKAGVYVLNLQPQSGFEVVRVKGDGVEDWQVSTGRLAINFNAKLLGSRALEVRLERVLPVFPESIPLEPLRVAGAKQESAKVGVLAAAGIRLKTGEAVGLREVPVTELQPFNGEILAYTSQQAGWRLALAAERPQMRLVADVFNLVSIGDGMLGGSATIRYSVLNQGMQQLRLRLPEFWKNVEFTGPGIRGKELTNGVWTITLQDKAWNAYTLVISYDAAFDPKGAKLTLGGAHALDVDRETGQLAITAVPGLELKSGVASDSLRRIDETELSAADRALLARAALLAYRYNGSQFELPVEVTRFEQTRLLDAVADRTELVTVLTEAGQMLTQASFMVKNNEKQFQRFKLPEGADFWSCHVNGQPVKTEKDGAWLLVPLPREANRNQVFAVDLVYAHKTDSLAKGGAKHVLLAAPTTDVPNTYAEWQWYAPENRRLSGFGGSMTVDREETYDAHEAWRQAVAFYVRLLRDDLGAVLGLVSAGLFAIVLMVFALRRGWRGLASAFVVLGVAVVLGIMLLPSAVQSKRVATYSAAKEAESLAANVQAVDSFALADNAPAAAPAVAEPESKAKVEMSAAMKRRYGLMETKETGDKQPNQSLYEQRVPARASVPSTNFLANRTWALSGDAPASAVGLSAANDRLGFAAGDMRVGGAGGAAAFGTPMTPAIAGKPDTGEPMAAGIRPIRIEIPKEGRSYRFTKVLNITDEPLTIEAKLSDRDSHQVWQSILESLGFLLGILMIWGPWRERRQGLGLAAGVLLLLLSGGHWLAAHQLLHYALIVGLPLLAILLFTALLWRFVPKRPTLPPVVPTATALLMFAALPWTQAQEALLSSHALPVAIRPVIASDPLPTGVSILKTKLDGETRLDTARLDVDVAITTSATNSLVKLFGNEVAVQEFSATPAARLVRLDAGYYVQLPTIGSYSLKLQLLVKTSAATPGKQLAFHLPPALKTTLAIALDEPEAEVEFPSAIAFQKTFAERKTRVEATLGTAGGVDLRWTPRVKRAGEVAATVFCENTAIFQLAPNGAQCRAVLEYQITQGELWQCRVTLPPNHRLMRVQGEAIRTWNLRPATSGDARPGAQELMVELLKGIPQHYQLIVETELPVATLPANITAEIPHALEAKRETGYVAVQAGEDLTVLPTAKDLQRLDAGDFEKLSGQKLANAIGTYRFMRPAFELRLAIDQAKPELEATVLNAFAVGLEDTRLETVIQYRIKRLGVFALQVALPAGFQVEKVEGEKILQWTQNQGVLEVTLAERSGSQYRLRLSLVRAYAQPPATLELAGALPLGTAKTAGFATVGARLGLALRTASRAGLNEVPPTAVEMELPAPPQNAPPLPAVALAFKHNTAEAWKLTLGVDKVDPWIRAETATTIQIGETVATGRTMIRYEIANAPAREFRIRVPAACTNVEISGADIRVRDQQGTDWRIVLQNPFSGSYNMVVTWEVPRAAATNMFEHTGITALGVERETGYLAIFAKAPLQVTEQTATELARIDTREWPDWAGAARETAAMAYRYLRPGYRVQLAVQRHEEAAVLQALVDSAEISTVVAASGQTMTEMRLIMRNNGRQFLSMELPAGAQVWSAMVGGQPVRPCWRQGQLLLPLEREARGGEAVSVELVWIATNAFPRTRGDWAIASPKLDVPWKNAVWRLYLPQDYRYSDFGGTMTPVIPTETPAVARYSSADYLRVETRRDSALSSEAKSNLTLARSQLQAGEVAQAASNVRQLRRNLTQNQSMNRAEEVELKQMEGDLGQALGLNMLQAQNEFSERNGNPAFQMMLGKQVAGQPIINHYFNYDAAVAGRQAQIVQKAQEFVAAPLQPLRVNLPSRGVLYTFNQALQTELQKPLVIQLRAANDKSSGWFAGVFQAASAMVLLWLVWVLWPKKAAVA